jgi:hypothetical protein
LARITDIFMDVEAMEDPEEFVRQINQLLSLKQLRKDLMSIFRETDLPTFIFTYFENWHGFLGQLFRELIGRVIEFPQDNQMHRFPDARRIFDSIADRASHDPRRMVSQLRLVDDVPGEPGKVHWCIKTEAGIYYTGKLTLDEPRSAFLPDPAVG